MSKLATLKDARAKAREELDRVTKEFDPILTERALTPDEETRLDEARRRFEQVESRYAEAKADKERREKEEEKRAKAGVTVRVGKEPMTYSEANPDHSWYRDLLMVAGPAGAMTPAAERLRRHQQEIDGIFRSNPRSKEGRAIADYAREVRRMNGSTYEVRDVSTQTSSMGDFAPPLYFLTDYAPYRTYGRTLIDQMKKMPMPETGMVFNIPKITTPTQAKQQGVVTATTQGAGQNTTVTSRTLTSTYEVGAVQTLVDNLLVSQQYLDRVGPGIGGDQIVRDDQQRQVNRTLNVFAWKKIMATATVGTVAYTGVSTSTHKFTGATFNQTVAKASAAISKTDGTVAYPTHFISDVDLWQTLMGAYDKNNRPFVVPQGVAFNPLAVGEAAAVPEGYTGFEFAGVRAFKDQANFVAWQTVKTATSTEKTWHVGMIADLSVAAYWIESTPVIRVLPQPYANQLTVLIQEYVYCAYVPLYPKAIQLVRGAGTKTTEITA